MTDCIVGPYQRCGASGPSSVQRGGVATKMWVSRSSCTWLGQELPTSHASLLSNVSKDLVSSSTGYNGEDTLTSSPIKRSSWSPVAPHIVTDTAQCASRQRQILRWERGGDGLGNHLGAPRRGSTVEKVLAV